MDPRTHLGLHVLVAALLLGLIGDLLLRAAPWGVNFFLWLALLLAAAPLLGKRHGCARSEGGQWPVPAALLFAAFLAWRDARALQLLNVGAAAACLALALWRAHGGRLSEAGPAAYLVAFRRAAGDALAGPVRLVFGDVRWTLVADSPWSGHALAGVRGAALALPLLFVFGGLFRSADAAFAGLVDEALELRVPVLASHVALALGCGWLSAGVLRGFLLAGRTEPGRSRTTLAFGPVETVTILAPLNLLFALFLLVQLRYLFGGAAVVTADGALTYAAYARRGFFELVTVSALGLPLLLFLNWTLRDVEAPVRRLFRGLALGLTGQLFVVMLSAGLRMSLYQHAYGLTELRVYTTAFMLWLALVLAWLTLTVLRGRPARFAFGSFAAGLAVLLGLNLVSPDALVARVNVARSRQGARFDGVHAAGLSADAVPVLLRALPDLEPEAQRRLASALLARRPGGGRDWRSWNHARQEARRRLRTHDPLLRRMQAYAAPAPGLPARPTRP